MAHPPRIERALLEALATLGIDDVVPQFERPRDPSHGDWATNVALTLAGRLRKPPRVIAQALADAVQASLAESRARGEAPSGIAAVEVAGPGFLNVRLDAATMVSVVDEILKSNMDFGRSTSGAFEGAGGGDRPQGGTGTGGGGDHGSLGPSGPPAGAEDGGTATAADTPVIAAGTPVMIEFVSANPTGLLHLGHGRQAALGDAIASLLGWAGHDVYREFYYNDAGRQIERLAESLRARYHQHFGRDVAIPEDGYHASTLVELAEELAGSDGERWLDPEGPEGEAEAMNRFRRFAVDRLRQEQDRDLTTFRVRFDRYYLESSLYDEGRVEQTIADLRGTGHVYDHEGAVWLRTTAFGDQKDRVMVKSDGSPTYFLPDVAYHVTKWERGFHQAINVQGADHHGTTARVHAGLQALGLPQGFPEYVLHQMVTVERGGVEVKFSKRAGDYVTLRDLVEEVGVDVTRYFFLMRKPEAHLVFDLEWAADQSDRNPVYKAQYAHARMCSILRKAGVDEAPPAPGSAPLHRLEDPGERELVRVLSTFPETLLRAARARAPHLVCDWLEQTAGEVNAWYHAGNPARNPQLAVLSEDPELRAARLALTWAVRITLRNALAVLGISAPEAMHRELAEAAPTAGSETVPEGPASSPSSDTGTP